MGVWGRSPQQALGLSVAKGWMSGGAPKARGRAGVPSGARAFGLVMLALVLVHASETVSLKGNYLMIVDVLPWLKNKF